MLIFLSLMFCRWFKPTTSYLYVNVLIISPIDKKTYCEIMIFILYRKKIWSVLQFNLLLIHTSLTKTLFLTDYKENGFGI